MRNFTFLENHIEVSISFIRLIFVSGGDQSLLRRIRVSLSFVLFLILCAVAGAVSAICVCWACDACYSCDSRLKAFAVLGNLGFRGFVIGLLYGLHYVYNERWILQFQIIQRPPFFSFKMGLPLSVLWASRFSATGFVISGVLALFLPAEYRSQCSARMFIVEQTVFYIESFVVILCWELNHHLHQKCGEKYQIKGCAGQGGFAQVFKAYLNSNHDDVVALKIQKPRFPWEFYMYRHLDMRIPENESFGFAHRLYLYSDYNDGKEEDKNTCRR
ncbi:hypothetical protein OROHE_014448 [Orobanche hederae]